MAGWRYVGSTGVLGVCLGLVVSLLCAKLLLVPFGMLPAAQGVYVGLGCGLLIGAAVRLPKG